LIKQQKGIDCFHVKVDKSDLRRRQFFDKSNAILTENRVFGAVMINDSDAPVMPR